MRAALVLVAATGCNALLGNSDFSTNHGDGGSDAPIDAFDACTAQGKPTTSLSGTVFAPNGTLPLFGAAVYVPTTNLAAIPSGVGAPVCASGSPVSFTRSDPSGHFKLANVPAGNVELVIQVGKWRREVTVQNVTACTDNPVDALLTRLPKNGTEGSMPRIAITTGAADSLECVMRDIGVDDAELAAGNNATHHVNLFAENGTGLLAGTQLPTAATLFTAPTLATYDIVMLGCPGQPSMIATPPATAAARAWTDQGGWLFLTHFESQWLTAGPAPWSSLAVFTMAGSTATTGVVSVDTHTPIGQAHADWLLAVGASTNLGQFPLMNAKNSCASVDTTLATHRMFLDPALNAGATGVQGFTWDAAAGGRVTFDDIHVSGLGGMPTQSFPSECVPPSNTPQEKALMFQLFETPTCDPP